MSRTKERTGDTVPLAVSLTKEPGGGGAPLDASDTKKHVEGGAPPASASGNDLHLALPNEETASALLPSPLSLEPSLSTANGKDMPGIDKEALREAWGFMPSTAPPAHRQAPILSAPPSGPPVLGSEHQGQAPPYCFNATLGADSGTSVQPPAVPTLYPVTAFSNQWKDTSHALFDTGSSTAAQPHVIPPPLHPATASSYQTDILPSTTTTQTSISSTKTRAPSCDDEIPLELMQIVDPMPQVGRPSKEVLEMLEQAFSDINALVRQLSMETGLSIENILTRWNLQTGRAKNAWNMYQKYFKANLTQELCRIGHKVPEGEKDPQISQKTKAECLSLFKEAHGDAWEDILHIANKIEELDGKDITSLQKRALAFEKGRRQMEKLV